MSDVVDRKVKSRHWKDQDGNVQTEETTVLIYDDGSKQTTVANQAPAGARTIDEARAQRVSADIRATDADVRRRAERRNIEEDAARRSALEKLTKLGLTADEARAIGGM